MRLNYSNLIFLFLNIKFTISLLSKHESLCSQIDSCSNDDDISKIAFNNQVYYTERNCYCDDECRIYNDCCEDYEDNSSRNYKKRNFVCNLRRTLCDTSDKNSFIYSIGECPEDYNEDKLIAIKCALSNHLEETHGDHYHQHFQEDTFLRWPFYSNLTKFTYNNIYCAMCNGEKTESLQPWHSAFQCDRALSIATNSTSNAFDNLKKKCTFAKWMASYMKFRYCRNNLVSTCDVASNNAEKLELDYKCRNGPYKVRYPITSESDSTGTKVAFRNEYCAKCLDISKSSCLKSFNYTSKYRCIATEVTWSLFFDFNFFQGEYKVGFKKLQNGIQTEKCDKESFFDPFSRTCRKTHYENFNISEIHKNCKFYSNDDLLLLNETKLSNSSVFDYKLIDYSMIQNISEAQMAAVAGNMVSNNQNRVLVCDTANESNIERDSTDSGTRKFESVHKILTIIGLTVSMIALVILIIIYSVYPKLRNLFGKDLICLSATYILVYLIMIASMILTRSIEKSYISYVQDLHTDKHHESSIGRFTVMKHSAFWLAALLHYAILCTFSWITIISFDICQTFRDKNGHMVANSDLSHDRYLFKIHLLFGYLVLPSLPVIIGILLDFFNSDSNYAPQYGGFGDYHTIWITNRLSLFILFTIPVAIMIFVNITFFLITLYSIIKTDKSTNAATMSSSAKKSRKSRILLFAKLLIIMGLSWLLGLLAGLFDKEWLFILHTICNEFQGFFIFLCFTFTRKVMKLLKASFTSFSFNF